MSWRDWFPAMKKTPVVLTPDGLIAGRPLPPPPPPPKGMSMLGVPTFSAIRPGGAAWLKARGIKTRVIVADAIKGDTLEALEQMDLHAFMVLAFDADEAGQAFQGAITIKGTRFLFNAAGVGIKFTRGKA